MRIKLITLSIFAIITTIALAEEKKEHDKLESRIYDVRDIDEYPEDIVPLLTSYFLPLSDLGEGMSYHGDPFAPSNSNALPSIIKDRLLPMEFINPETSIKNFNGHLVVMQHPKVHKLISEIICNIRAIIKLQIVVKAFLVSSAEPPDATYFDEESLKKVLDAGVILASPRLIGINSQYMHLTIGRGTTYIRDYDIQGDYYDPVAPAVLDGSIFDVRPTLSSDGNFVELDIVFKQNSNVVKRLQSIGLTTSSATTSAPVSIQRTESKDEKGAVFTSEHIGTLLDARYLIRADLDLPSAEVNRVRAQVVAPIGKWVLAAVMNNRDHKIKEKHLLLFVSAEVLDKAEKERGFLLSK